MPEDLEVISRYERGNMQYTWKGFVIVEVISTQLAKCRSFTSLLLLRHVPLAKLSRGKHQVRGPGSRLLPPHFAIPAELSGPGNRLELSDKTARRLTMAEPGVRRSVPSRNLVAYTTRFDAKRLAQSVCLTSTSQDIYKMCLPSYTQKARTHISSHAQPLPFSP